MTHQSPPAQASDEPMRADFEAWMISEAQRQHPVEPLTEKEKAYVLRRNVWDKESYEGHDGAWQSWKAAYALYATPRATADVEQIDGDMLVLKLREAGIVNGRGASWLLNGDSMPFNLEGLLNVIRIAVSK